jgi:hypothetical protein
MNPTITLLYEPASSNGYSHTGDGEFYLCESTAQQVGLNRHGGYAVAPIQHDTYQFEPGRYLLLRSTQPVAVVGTAQATQHIAKAALGKLTPAERKALGLTDKTYD